MTREEEIDGACTHWICSQENGTVIMARNVWRAAVEWADAHPNWISVEDELPKESGKYLFYHDKIGVQLAYYYNDRTLDKAVTHWMPIPQPPRKEE